MFKLPEGDRPRNIALCDRQGAEDHRGSRADSTERIDILREAPGVRIERIVSWGQASPPSFWYDQPEGEWVVLLSGGARLRLQGPDEDVELHAGDWLWIAAHRRHRVEWTAPDIASVWLAVFMGTK